MASHLIPTAALHRWVIDLFRAAGSSDREATLTADHLVGANLAGHDSHGVGMAPRYVDSLLNHELQLNQTVAVTTDTGPMLSVDGRRGMGQSVAFQAMELAIARARQHGVCVLGLRHSHHLGRVGHWAEQAVAAGLVSIHFTNAVSRNPMVAPHGGGEGRFNTNPFTVGMPRNDGGPIVLDFATSAIAAGKVRVAYNKQVPVPPGCLIDAEGQPTDDPAVLFEPPEGPHGALVPFARHKGFALSMVCELLGAALTGGETTHPANLPARYGVWNNMLAIVFDPARMAGGQGFEAEARHFVDWVQSARLSADGQALGGILMPGDIERRTRAERAQQVPVDSGTLAQLDQAAAAIGARFGQSPGPVSALERGC
ncbi:MAG: malate/lactate/ureidoglycolate dehydrogenase [Burkholderiales bacterium]|nr:malate/lactate/ureidoglycolate dehydrogenase [Burkholderiales bacterium]